VEGSSAGASPLKEAQAAFIQSGVATTVASASAQRVPNLGRAVGCSVSPDGTRITVLLRRSQAGALLDDIERSRAVAVVFAQPSTHRTLQIKSADAVVDTRPAIDAAALAAYADAFYRELAPLGYQREFTSAMLAYDPGDLVAVAFTPQAIFSQTPGPRAGERVA
jgi:hypothetical protein